MRSLRNRSFLDTWRTVYRATNPQADRDAWRCDGVEWVRESHAHRGQHCGFRIETHLLAHRSGRDPWLLLVVVERWWPGRRGEVLRSNEWCKVLEGSSRHVLAWFSRQRDRLDGSGTGSGSANG